MIDYKLSGLRVLFLLPVPFLVSSGSITVNADSSVQLLAEEAVTLENLDVSVSTFVMPNHYISGHFWCSRIEIIHFQINLLVDAIFMATVVKVTLA